MEKENNCEEEAEECTERVKKRKEKKEGWCVRDVGNNSTYKKWGRQVASKSCSQCICACA